MHSLTNLVPRWLDTWTIARGIAPAVDVPGGKRVTLGLPGRHHEYVAPDADGPPEELLTLVGELVRTSAASWLTTFTNDLASLRANLSDLDFFADPETFMTVDLAEQAVVLPADPYTVATTFANGVISARVTCASGEAAARGLMAVRGADAVAHGILTEEAHRRRGLGGVVMTALVREAMARGAVTGLLIASDAGERLYAKLGWTSHARVVTVRP